MPKLFASRYSNSLSSPSLLETFDRIESLGIRWSLEGFGIERIELTVPARNRNDLYDRLENHHGQRIAVYPSYLIRPMSGFVSEVQAVGFNRVKYIVKGASWRLENLLDTSFYDLTPPIREVLINTLTNYAPIIDSTDFDDIEANPSSLAGWQPKFPEGSYPSEVIEAILEKRDDSSKTFDFWIQDQPFNGVSLQKFKAYYKSRSNTSDIGWIVSLSDLSDLSLARDINEVVTHSYVYFGTLVGTVSAVTSYNVFLPNLEGELSGTSLVLNSGIVPGDKVTNVTRNFSTKVLEVSSSLSRLITELPSNVSSGTATGGSSTTLQDTGANFVADGVLVGDVVVNAESMDLTGTATGGSTTTLQDSGAAFGTDGVAVGDIVENTTDGSSGAVTAVTATQLTITTLTGGTNNTFTASDEYRIQMNNGASSIVTVVATTQLTFGALSGGRVNSFASGDSYRVHPKFSASDLISIELQNPVVIKKQSNSTDQNYWQIEKAEFKKSLSRNQATAYAATMLSADPKQTQSFSITAPFIKDGNGAKWPLWEVISQGRAYIRITDLYPNTALFGLSSDSLSTFLITALDYDYSTNTLRVQVDVADPRLDVQLKRSGILPSAIINRPPQKKRYR